MDLQLLRNRLLSYDVPLFALGGADITLFSALKLVLLLVALLWLAGALRRWVIERALVHTQLDRGTRQAAGSLVRYTVLVIGVALIVQNAGVNLSALGVLAGAIGVGVGFGLQNVVSNFVSGLIIILERPVKVGDRIELAGIEGEVQEIGARRTTVVTEDRMAVLVPNQRFILENVTNQVYVGTPIRLRVGVQVASDTDPELMRALLTDVAREQPGVLEHPAPEALITALGGAATAYELGVWHEAGGPPRRRLASELSFRVARRLQERGVKRA